MDTKALVRDVSLGAWVDIPKRKILTPKFVEHYASLNFDMMAVMIDQSDSDPTLSFSPKDVEVLSALLDPFAIELVLTTWAYPRRGQIDALCRQMRELMRAGPVVGWENDVEFNWNSRVAVVGFPSLDAAGDYLIEQVTAVCKEQDARAEFTTFTEHAENSARADVTPHADRISLQAYSVSSRKDSEGRSRPVAWSGNEGPGKMQVRTLDRAALIPGIADGQPQVCVGLASYLQNFPGHSVDEAMRLAVHTACSHKVPVVELRWWSIKHILDNSTYEDFFRSLR